MQRSAQLAGKPNSFQRQCVSQCVFDEIDTERLPLVSPESELEAALKQVCRVVIRKRSITYVTAAEPYRGRK